MSGHILWNGQSLPFTAGESLAQALNRSGVLDFGPGPSGLSNSVFCGIGQCQNCLVILKGLGPREACLTLCSDGLAAGPVEAGNG